MPKIVVREFDKTTAVGAPYSNFAVVVPGFVKNEDESFKPNLAVFDENNVYECKDKDEFKKNVGLVSPISHKVANAKAPTKGDGWLAPAPLSETEFNELVATGKLYVATLNTEGEIGKYKDANYIYNLAEVEEKDEYVFENTEAVSEGEEAIPSTLFMILEDIGHNEIEESHYGNQIAYELLALGYTVLYKRLDNLTYLEQDEFWAPLKDKTLYDFRYVMSGLLRGNEAVYRKMLDVVEFTPENKKFDEVDTLSAGRGDCIALFDIDENVYKGLSQKAAIDRVISFAEKVPASKYAAAFVPAVKYSEGSLNDVNTFNNQWFPASFHYLACAARSSENFSEWYANAGYSRGISKYNIESVGCKFGEAAVNMFQRRSSVQVVTDAGTVKVATSINPIINLRGSYYVWGNRTTHPLGDVNTADGDLKASHFLNIRQLCSTIKKQVYVTCRQATFNPNSDTLWINFCNSIKPMLEKMKADQGISDYKILKVKNGRKAFLSAIIRIVPIEAVEDFDISVYLEDSLNGTIANTEE